jgi:hypothetical protein
VAAGLVHWVQPEPYAKVGHTRVPRVLVSLEGWVHSVSKEENCINFWCLKLPRIPVHQSITLTYLIGLSRCVVGGIFEFLALKRLNDC